jgi:hypothetical protein
MAALGDICILLQSEVIAIGAFLFEKQWNERIFAISRCLIQTIIATSIPATRVEQRKCGLRNYPFFLLRVLARCISRTVTARRLFVVEQGGLGDSLYDPISRYHGIAISGEQGLLT